VGRRVRKRSRYGRRRVNGRTPFNKRLHVPSALVRNTKPYVYEYDHGFGVYSGVGAAGCYFLEYDTTNRYDSVMLGGGGASPDNPSLGIDSPQLIRRMQNVNVFTNILGGGSIATSKQVYWLSPREYCWTIADQESHPVKVDVYWCTPRHDIHLDATLYAGLTQTWVGNDCNDVLFRALTVDGCCGVGINVLKAMVPSFSPYESTTFCKMWKIVKKREYELKAGQCLKLKHTTKDWWKLNDYYERTYANTVAWAKRTVMPLIVQRGCPVTDSTNYARCDTGVCRLNIRYSVRTKVYQENVTEQKYQKEYATAPAGGVAFASTVYMSNPVSGNVPEV